MEGIPELMLKDYLKTSLRRELTALTFVPKKQLTNSFFTKSLPLFTRIGLEYLHIKIDMSTPSYEEELYEIVKLINRN